MFSKAATIAGAKKAIKNLNGLDVENPSTRKMLRERKKVIPSAHPK